MRWALPTGREPIGLDVGERHVKAVQCSRRKGGLRVEAAACLPRLHTGPTVTRDEVQRLRRELPELGFRGEGVILAVPHEKLLTGIMELPPEDSGAPLAILARSELARMHRCDPQGFEMACWSLPAPARASNTTFVMGAACTHRDADRLLDLFEDENFAVERLEIQARALVRACLPMLHDTDGVAGVLDLGWSAGRLILVYHDTLVYERKLAKSGLAALILARADATNTRPPQIEHMLADGQIALDDGAESERGSPAAWARGMVDEMRTPLSYLANQYSGARLERLLLVGGGARVAGLADHLAGQLECAVQTVAPSDLAEGAETLDRTYGPTLTTALGLGKTHEG